MDAGPLTTLAEDLVPPAGPHEPDADFRYAGDTTLIVQFGERIDQQVFAKVTRLQRHVQALSGSGQLVGLVETVPTFRSLAIIFDPLITDHASVIDVLGTQPMEADDDSIRAARHWRFPVCYGGAHGPDLPFVAEATGTAEAQLVAQHQAQQYTVYMLGFLPGFGFLGDLPSGLRLPRRSSPRTRVPQGSVAIAMQLTCVYPWDSPGGWHLIGHCPVPFFNADAAPPALLQPGDSVGFTAVTANEASSIHNDLLSAAVAPDSYCTT